MIATPKRPKTDSSTYGEDMAGMTEGSCNANRICCEIVVWRIKKKTGSSVRKTEVTCTRRSLD